MAENSTRIILRDATLREGLDTPNVAFTLRQRLSIAAMLEQAHVPEIEIVAPGKFEYDLEFAKQLKHEGTGLRTSGLIYAYHPAVAKQIDSAHGWLDRFDILMPASAKRPPVDEKEKIKLLSEAIRFAVEAGADVGAGFPNSFQADDRFVSDLCREAVRAGSRRITVYDTNGGSDPFAVRGFVNRLKRRCPVPLFFHGHNDLGMATANSLAAVLGGADGLDVTINGLGDRAGNAALEQVAVGLYVKKFETGVRLKTLKGLSGALEKESGVGVSKLAPIVGEYVFQHKSPGHLETAGLFEPFSPELLGTERQIVKT